MDHTLYYNTVIKKKIIKVLNVYLIYIKLLTADILKKNQQHNGFMNKQTRIIFSPFLMCCSSLGTFCAVDLRAMELLPVLSFPDPLLERDPSSLGNLLWVAMATEAMVSLLHVVRCRVSSRLAGPSGPS